MPNDEYRSIEKSRNMQGRRPSLVVMLALIAALLTMVPATPGSAAPNPPVVPGLAGFGTTTPAGRGGEVIHVTNLADQGPGSLRACLAASGKRVCVFDVGGVIDVRNDLRIDDPFVTVAGQTAPSPGITVIGAGLKIKTHDVLVQHIRIRPGARDVGPAKENRDAVTIAGNRQGTLAVRNIVLDHVSLTWSTDEVLSTWYPKVRNITIANSIVGEALKDAGHPKGDHSMGLLIGADTKNVTIRDNLFINNQYRNPSLKNQTRSVVANNLIVNPGSEKIHFSEDSDYRGWTSSNILANALVRGRDTGGDHLLSFGRGFPTNAAIYLDGNSPNKLREGSGLELVDAPPIGMGAYRPHPVGQVQDHVVANVGARPADRDRVDTRLTDPARWASTRIINRPSEVEGLPVVTAPVVRPFIAPPNPTGDADGDGYTNLEERLHEMAAEVEGGEAPDPAPTPEPRPTPRPQPTPSPNPGDDVDVALTLGKRDGGRYGCDYPGAEPFCDRLTVGFSADGDSHTLWFKTWDIEGPEDVALYLNGDFLMNVPRGVDNGHSRRVTVELSGSVVDDGENVLEFRRLRMGSWGVKDIRVDDT